MKSGASRTVLCLMPEDAIEGLEGFRQRHIHNPGKAVPFHVTLLYQFYLPEHIDEGVLIKLKQIAQGTPRFDFLAKPLSSFPTSRVLYLTPSPAAPIEELVVKLYRAFPDYHNAAYGLPVFHMTIALGNPPEQVDGIIKEYFDMFGKSAQPLRAGRLALYGQYGEEWAECLSIELGQ